MKLISDYDAACEDFDRRPSSKAAAKRFTAILKRLVKALERSPVEEEGGEEASCR